MKFLPQPSGWIRLRSFVTNVDGRTGTKVLEGPIQVGADLETNPVLSIRRPCGAPLRATLLVAAILCVSATAEATQFTFTLAKDARTSAGVFSVGGTSDGTLIKTLWSGVPYAAGTYTKDWDGTDDTGRLASDGSYQIRVLTSNMTYTWQGVVGNTSTQKTGDKVFHFYSTIAGMAAVGGTTYFATGYNEAGTSQASFDNTQLGVKAEKTNILSRGAPFYKVASDGSNVYWAGNDMISKGFVMATPVGSATDQTPLANGVLVDTTNLNGIGYTHAIDVNTDPTGVATFPTGLAVQPDPGRYLFVAWKGQNSLHVLDKTTGEHASPTWENAFPAPGDLAVGPVDAQGVGSLWMIYGPDGSRVVERFSVTNSGEVQLPREVAINGLKDPLALAYRNGILLVADGGESQQVKAFDSSGAPLWELPETPGGYTMDPAVANDKFDFEPHLEYTNTTSPWTPIVMQARGTFLAFQDDGSFWVGDTGCYRAQHFSASRAYLDQVSYLPAFYSAAVDPNNPSRVFANYLEFEVNYDLEDLEPSNGSWSLVRNWRPGAEVPNAYLRMSDVTTLSNGRTYINKGDAFELPAAGGGQPTDTGSGVPGVLFPDGTGRSISMTENYSVETWLSYPFLGFDGTKPLWASTPNTLASVALGLKDPRDYDTRRFGNMTAGNVIVSFDINSLNTIASTDPYHRAWHLAGIRKDTNQWLWKASDSAPLNFHGLWPTDGTFPITNVYGAGSAVMTVDRHIIYGYHGEGWRPGVNTIAHCEQTNKYRHYYDDGLFVDEFGPTWFDVGCAEAGQGMAGNAFSSWLVKLADGRVYMYHNDESWHGGLHRWKIDGLSSVAEQMIPIEVHKDTDHGLNAEYFDTPDWNNLYLRTTRLDPQVAFSGWDAGPPAGTGLTDDQSFSVRWSGYVIPPLSGNMRFRVTTQDPASAKVHVDGQVRAATDDVSLTSGVYYPISIEYRHIPGTPAPTGPRLRWSSDPQLAEQDVPSTQLSAIPAGTDLMDGLPSSGVLTDGTAGWNRSAATDYYADYWHRWFVDFLQNDGNPYLYVYRVDNTPGTSSTVTRDLGTPSSTTTSWELSMSISYNENWVTDANCGQELQVLDDAGKVIATFYPQEVTYPNDARIFGNSAVIAQDTTDNLTFAIMPPWRLLRISAANGTVSFQYGDFPAVTTAVQDPTADWRRAKTLRLYNWTGQTYCAHYQVVSIDRLRFARNQPAQDIQPLMAGLPSTGVVADGTAGWNRSAATDYYTDYWHRWFVDVSPNDGSPYLYVHRVDNTAGTSSTVTRDLGMPSSTTARWDLTMKVSYNENWVTDANCGQTMQVLDDAGRIIAAFYPREVTYPNDARIFGNTAVIAQDTTYNLTWSTMVPWLPLRISAENGAVSFQYGAFPAVTTGVLDPTADWRRAKTFRLYYWTSQGYCAHDQVVSIDDLQWATSDQTVAVDLLAGLPVDGDLQSWGANGDYGWSLTAPVPTSPQSDYSWARTNQMTVDRSPPVDIGVVYHKVTAVGDANHPDLVLARDLGTASDSTTSWVITGRINNFESELNVLGTGGQNLEVLDDAGHVIARFTPPDWEPSWQALRIVGENGSVTFSYGNHAPVVVPAETGSNWRRAKIMRVAMWKTGGSVTLGTAYLDDLKYRVTRGP